MLNDNLQKLTDRLYEEGLSKGKQEGEELVAKAKTEAEKIVEAAKEQAKAIIAEAEKKAAELAQKTEADIKMASEQSIAATRHEIENMIVAKASEKPVNELLGTPEFVKEMITSIVKAFNPANATPTDGDTPDDTPALTPEQIAEIAKQEEAEMQKKREAFEKEVVNLTAKRDKIMAGVSRGGTKG